MKIITKDDKEYLQEIHTVDIPKGELEAQLETVNSDIERLVIEKKELKDKLNLFKN